MSEATLVIVNCEVVVQAERAIALSWFTIAPDLCTQPQSGGGAAEPLRRDLLYSTSTTAHTWDDSTRRRQW
jgi:hypothetical protein